MARACQRVQRTGPPLIPIALGGRTIPGGTMRRRSIVVLLGLAGCASHGAPSGTAPAAVAPRPCSPSDAVNSAWRFVRATGFTFCVPADWRGDGTGTTTADARTWTAGGNSISWGTGQAPVRTFSMTARVRPGAPFPTPCQVDRNNENVGGAAASVYSNECQGMFQTGAVWSRPQVYMQGEASTPSAAAMELSIYRTVRFDPVAPSP